MTTLVRIKTGENTYKIVCGEYLEDIIENNFNGYQTRYYRNLTDWLEQQIAENNHRGDNFFLMHKELDRLKKLITESMGNVAPTELTYTMPFILDGYDVIAGQDRILVKKMCEKNFGGKVECIINVSSIHKFNGVDYCTVKNGEVEKTGAGYTILQAWVNENKHLALHG